MAIQCDVYIVLFRPILCQIRKEFPKRMGRIQIYTQCYGIAILRENNVSTHACSRCLRLSNELAGLLGLQITGFVFGTSARRVRRLLFASEPIKHAIIACFRTYCGSGQASADNIAALSSYSSKTGGATASYGLDVLSRAHSRTSVARTYVASVQPATHV